MRKFFIGPLSSLALSASILGAVPCAAAAQSVEPFYKGRKIDLIIGYGPGGGYDLYGRLVASFIGRHIPGEPTVVAENMPGAGSIRAANYLYNAAPKDGTAIGIVASTVALENVLGTPSVRYDAGRFDWIGRVASNIDVLVTWHTSKVKTIDDAMKYVAVMPGPSSGIVPAAILNHVVGTKFKIITGYPGSSENTIFMEKGEVDGVATAWTKLKQADQAWIKNKIVNLLVQFDAQRYRDLQNVPDMVELGKTPEQRKVLSLFASMATIGRAIFAPPGVPAERVKALRDAFQAMLKDPGFIAQAKTMNADLDPVSGAELQKQVAEVSDVSPAVRQEAIAARGR